MTAHVDETKSATLVRSRFKDFQTALKTMLSSDDDRYNDASYAPRKGVGAGIQYLDFVALCNGDISCDEGGIGDLLTTVAWGNSWDRSNRVRFGKIVGIAATSFAKCCAEHWLDPENKCDLKQLAVPTSVGGLCLLLGNAAVGPTEPDATEATFCFPFAEQRLYDALVTAFKTADVTWGVDTSKIKRLRLPKRSKFAKPTNPVATAAASPSAKRPADSNDQATPPAPKRADIKTPALVPANDDEPRLKPTRPPLIVTAPTGAMSRSVSAIKGATEGPHKGAIPLRTEGWLPSTTVPTTDNATSLQYPALVVDTQPESMRNAPMRVRKKARLFRALCKFDLQGTCAFGDTCNFAHLRTRRSINNTHQGPKLHAKKPAPATRHTPVLEALPEHPNDRIHETPLPVKKYTILKRPAPILAAFAEHVSDDNAVTQLPLDEFAVSQTGGYTSF
jgi:hypothetical protein